MAAAGRTATDSGEKKKQPGCKQFTTIDVSRAIEPSQWPECCISRVPKFTTIDVSPAIEPGQWPECCIYRVPKLLRLVEEKAYTPKLVHIGPLHHSMYHKSMDQPKDIEIQKLRYLKEFCERTKKSQEDLASIIQSDELKIRRCYSENLYQIDSEVFVKMILLDAIFIIEFFLRNRNPQYYEGDHIISKQCLRKHIWQDLILVENQLPYFVLKKLYNFVLNAQEDDQALPFLKLACNIILQKDDAVSEDEGKKVKHLTDLLRTYYNRPNRNKLLFPTEEVWSATKLDEVGVKFMAADPNKSSGLLDIKFNKKKYLEWFPCLTSSWLLACLPCLKSFEGLRRMQPLLEIPCLVIDDGTENIFRNIMALEQCHYPNEAYFCNYVILLDDIIDNEKDIELLVEKKIIVNMLGSNVAAAGFFNRLCLQIVADRSCYYQVIRGLQRHSKNHWSRIMARLERDFFGDFWRGAATVIGILLLANTLWGFLQPFVLKK